MLVFHVNKQVSAHRIRLSLPSDYPNRNKILGRLHKRKIYIHVLRKTPANQTKLNKRSELIHLQRNIPRVRNNKHDEHQRDLQFINAE